MRMWGLPPAYLCRKHLLGAHVECHMAVGTIQRGKPLGRFITDGLIATARIQDEHDALAAEVQRRGYRHNSPLVYVDTLALGRLDSTANLHELARRCLECRARMETSDD